LGWFTVLQSQLYFFALVTLLLIIFTRPLALKLFKSEDVASNTKALIGRHGIAIEDILPLRYGQVKVSGEIWTAVCQGDQEIKANEPVEIIGIDGVKLLVKKVVM
jgi:membrane protein implicated in regulation of membrane protease activity